MTMTLNYYVLQDRYSTL